MILLNVRQPNQRTRHYLPTDSGSLGSSGRIPFVPDYKIDENIKKRRDRAQNQLINSKIPRQDVPEYLHQTRFPANSPLMATTSILADKDISDFYISEEISGLSTDQPEDLYDNESNNDLETENKQLKDNVETIQNSVKSRTKVNYA